MTLPGEPELPDEAWREAAELLMGPDAGTDRHADWSGGWRMNAAQAVRLRAGDEERRTEIDLAREAASGTRPSAVLAGDTAHVDVEGVSVEFTLAPPPSLETALRHASVDASGGAVLTAPMPGRVIAVRHAVGDAVEEHDPVVVLEAMKMENAVTAPLAGTVTVLHVTVGQQVQRGDVLAELSA